jgi:hypothetical protein
MLKTVPASADRPISETMWSAIRSAGSRLTWLRALTARPCWIMNAVSRTKMSSWLPNPALVGEINEGR